MICPKCKAEYREGFTKCADCGIDLIPELPPEPSAVPKKGFVDFVPIRRYSNRYDADLARSFLIANGVNALTSSDDCGGLYPSASLGIGIRLLVDKENLERAEGILSKDYAAAPLDEDADMSIVRASEEEAKSVLHQYEIIPRLILPAFLCIITLYITTMLFELPYNIWTGFPYAMPIIIIVGAHALGHHQFAEMNGIQAYTPYFIPSLNIGTLGCYTKLDWPISDRKALIKIFIAGPMFGFITAWVFIIIGLFFSEMKDMTQTYGGRLLGETIITSLSVWAVLGNIPETKDIIYHPMAFAGWFGILYNACHLLPVGKFDGGRLVYALWGYRVTVWVSLISIAILIALGIFLPDHSTWPCIAILGLVSLIGLRQQYPTDQYDDQPLEKWLLVLVCIVAVILIVSFSLAPLVREPQG